MSEKRNSRLFAGARVLGYVSTHVPFVARFIKRRGEHLLCTSVGKWIHTYGCSHFRLISISGEHPGDITCLSGDNYHVYSAAANNIYAWRRGSELKHVYKGHKAPIRLMIPFGIHLISIDEDNVLKVFDIKDESQFLELTFEKWFKISAACHPPTYLNKILLGSKQGPLQLWNLRTSKLVYTFAGWKSAVVAIEPSPAVDVVAIALDSGKIILHNLQYDKTVVNFIHDWGKVSTMSFRLDGVPFLVTGSINGHIVCWDLEEKRAVSHLQYAHTSCIAGMQCLMSEPLMVTNSNDNTLKLWIFDMSDGGARLLRKREGLAKPPTTVHYCDPTGANLLVAGRDSSLHIMNTISETFNKNLGKASRNRKKSKRKSRLEKDKFILPPIVQLSSSMQRDKQWDSIAAIHRDLHLVTTWSYDKKKMGQHQFKTSSVYQIPATSLTVTSCGNFVVIGYQNGQVHRFNMQSGIHRDEYTLLKKPAHKGAVRGVETDLLNHRVITAGADELLKFWRFKSDKTSAPYHVLKLEDSVSMTKLHRDSALLAIANEDFTITMVDIDSMAVVRKFEGHVGPITSIEFDVQSRWLISSSMDCRICTWDIPSAQLVDIFSVKEPCTSLSMSPTGNFLATIHVGEIGVFLWSNKLLYEKIHLKPIDIKTADVLELDLPSTAPEKPEIDDIGVLDLGQEPEYKSPEQISEELITLSNQPASRWLNILNLDIVKKRNKPKTPLTVPESAPFFLPTISSLDLEFDLEKDNERNKDTKLLIPDSLSTLTLFAKKLLQSKDVESFKFCIEKVKTLAPAAIEAEVINMAPDVGGSIEVMNQFLLMINVMLRSNKDFELAQSYLSLFLKTHTKTIAESEELRNTLVSVEESATEAWSRLQSNLLYNICIVKALKDMF